MEGDQNAGEKQRRKKPGNVESGGKSEATKTLKAVVGWEQDWR